MRAALVLFASAISLAGWNQDEDCNVNSRYTVESVHVTERFVPRINGDLKQELDAVVGHKLDHSLLDRLASRMRRDLRVERVAVRVRRGDTPEHVTVEFEVQNGRRDFDVAIPKIAYTSRQGFSGSGGVTTFIGKTAVNFGLVTDGDELVERFSGLRASVERSSVMTRRLRLRFEFDSYRDQWNSSTLSALPADSTVPGVYRTRLNFEPTATLVIAPPLTWAFGVSFEQLGMQFPAARTESANSVESTLRFREGWEGGAFSRQTLDAGYTLRAATRTFSSDYVYVRHSTHARYEVAIGRNDLSIDFAAGGITGRAPLFERFVLGNASTLRGWNKFDLDPLGGDRVVHGSVDYRYRIFTVFYDTGVVWNGSTSSGVKQGAGCGFRADGKEGFLLAVAFPLRSGHVDPVLIAGFNF